APYLLYVPSCRDGARPVSTKKGNVDGVRLPGCCYRVFFIITPLLSSCIYCMFSVVETGRAPSPPLAMFDSSLICIFRILSVRDETGHAPSLQRRERVWVTPIPGVGVVPFLN
ncbi:hypothetical protein, partial [uncultured Parabacteroides sp.]|uniref:hypothetical protein n=1 Tax=uncultured Parabacteroides sp. TaxID=512312 RepID=UPI002616BD98